MKPILNDETLRNAVAQGLETDQTDATTDDVERRVDEALVN